MTKESKEHPAPEQPSPQHQTGEQHGTVKQSQLDRHNAEHTKHGSEGDRRRASNMQR
jgi:hypothetical protein